MTPSKPNKKEQRIKLRCEGSPVKWDGTIISTTPDSKRIEVRFDGPMEDTVLVAYGDRKMFSDAFDRDGKPTEDPKLMATGRWWEVL